MKLNIDQLIANQAEAWNRLVPWDFSITVNEKDYRIRPLTNADLGIFANLAKLPAEEGAAFMRGLFEGEAPDLEAMAADPQQQAKLQAIVMAIPVAFAEHVKKKAKPMAAAIAAELGRS